MSQDAVRDERNWYAYAENDPVRGIDPEGLKPQYDCGEMAREGLKGLGCWWKCMLGIPLATHITSEGARHIAHAKGVRKFELAKAYATMKRATGILAGKPMPGFRWNSSTKLWKAQGARLVKVGRWLGVVGWYVTLGEAIHCAEKCEH